MANGVPVPGYPHLRYIGGAAAKPAEQQLLPSFLSLLNRAAGQLGVVFDIFSGSGSPSVRGGGFTGDPHEQRIGADITVNGQPVGSYPGAVGVLHSLGLRSGATDFTYQGKPDPAHVDAVSSSGGATGGQAVSETYRSFYTRVLQALGAPTTGVAGQVNLDFLAAWGLQEGTKAKNNPLATTRDATGSTSFNSVGVKNYPDPATGASATAATIREYPTIAKFLKSGNPQAILDFPAGRAELNKWVTGQAGHTADTTYTNGIRHNFTGAASSGGSSVKDILNSVLPGLADAASGVVSGIEQAAGDVLAVPKFLATITDPHNILRGLQIVAGGVLVLVGVTLLARQVGLAADVPSIPVPPIPVE